MMVSVSERDEGEEELSISEINPPLTEEEILVKVHCATVKEMEGRIIKPLFGCSSLSSLNT